MHKQMVATQHPLKIIQLGLRQLEAELCNQFKKF